jgi:hypothetical protein
VLARCDMMHRCDRDGFRVTTCDLQLIHRVASDEVDHPAIVDALDLRLETLKTKRRSILLRDTEGGQLWLPIIRRSRAVGSFRDLAHLYEMRPLAYSVTVTFIYERAPYRAYLAYSSRGS